MLTVEEHSEVDAIVSRVGLNCVQILRNNNYAVCGMCLRCGIFEENANDVGCENCDCRICKEVLDLAEFAHEIITLMSQSYLQQTREE